MKLLLILKVFCFFNSVSNAKTLVVLMDGTWNEPEFETNGTFPQGDATNVEKLRYLLDSSSNQRIRYFRGIGTDGKQVLKIRDGAFGMSAKQKIDEAFQWISENYNSGDDLAIFGFSRGAATARMLAKKIWEEKVNDEVISIRFMGLWDTVAALGVPAWNLEEFRKQYHDAEEKLRIPVNVKHVTHLVSIDEDRSLFSPTLISCDSPSTTVNEVWFSGNHGDVGGGWEKTADEKRQLSDGTLDYMIRDAMSDPHRLKFVSGWDGNVKPPLNGRGKIHKIELEDPTKLLGGLVVREVTCSDGSQNPHIHCSVKEKYDRDLSYRPPQFEGGFADFEIVE